MFEHQIISDYFLSKAIDRPDVKLGIGDDCAILDIPAGKELVVTMDMYNACVHFMYPKKARDKNCIDCLTAIANPKITPAYDIGYKAAAVNLSDLAAMGAEPAWMTLALSLPEINPHWLEEFSAGFMDLLKRYDMALIGGDLSRGPLGICAQAHGFVDKGKAIRRDTASPGDAIFVSGNLGAPSYVLDLIRNEGDIKLIQQLLPTLIHPEPRVDLGLALRGIASAAMDISDGLATDLARLQLANQCGSTVYLDQLPVPALLHEHLSAEDVYEYAFAGGDEYELCFTVPPEKIAEVEKISLQLNIPLTRIGELDATASGTRLLNGGEIYAKLKRTGFEHFED